MDRKVDRHEIKYSISVFQAELLKRRLPALMRRDPNALADGSYFIRSLYFDDPDFTAYNEKLSGVKERTKYRIRFYNLDDSVMFLEKKSKDGDLSGKDSVQLDRKTALALMAGGAGLSAEKGLLGELGRLCRSGWRPSAVVDYDRWAFIYPAGNVRVTIDMDVRTCPFRTDVFDPRLLTVPVLDDGEAVLEVKYDAFLPAPVRALIEGVPKQRCAISKYLKCMSILE